jgi:F0F1-type ATP synthase assembly protein I
MILAALSLVHGDERMELLYFIASILIIVLPVTVFITMAWLIARQYFRERRAAAAAAAAEKAAPDPGHVG